MGLLPDQKDLKPHYKGSTFLAMNIKFNFDITGATILMQFKSKSNSPVAFFWETGVNITVVDEPNGEIILQQVNELTPPSGNYIFDLQVKFADGTSFTYWRGNMTVIDDNSRI
jgi:hypothetical protein